MLAILLASALTGQVVCSSCWSEADRAKVPYGNDGDVACAKRCAGKGIGQSLAVRDSSGTYKLYPLEAGDLPGGKKALQRITWSQLPGGKVRQFWESSTDGGKTWTVAFDGTYIRKS
jgi:hypothetical protein